MLPLRWCRCAAKLNQCTLSSWGLLHDFVSLSSARPLLFALLVERIDRNVNCACRCDLVQFMQVPCCASSWPRDRSIVLSRLIVDLFGVVALRETPSAYSVPLGSLLSVGSLPLSTVLDDPHLLNASRPTRGRDLDLPGPEIYQLVDDVYVGFG